MAIYCTLAVMAATAQAEESYKVKPLSVADGEVVHEEGDYDGDGEKEIRLENRHIRLIIEPAIGAVISSVYLKAQNQELTCRRSPDVAGGLLSDKVTEQSYAGDWNEAKYRYKVKKDQGSVSVTLWSPGRSGVLSYCTFRKTITLLADSAAIEADITFENSKRSKATLTHGLWIHNMFGGPLGQTALFFPISTGVLRLNLPHGSERQIWLRDPARGWCAALIKTNRTGMAARFEYRLTELLYSWYADVPVPTVEWRTLPQKIAAGRSLKTHVSFLPFAGLDEVHGATGDVVGSIAPAQKLRSGESATIEVVLCGAKAVECDVLLRAKRLPAGHWVDVGRKLVRIEIAKGLKLEFPWRPRQDGTYVHQVIPMVGGRQAGVLERPLTVGKASAVYVMEPESRRVSARTLPVEKISIPFNSMEAETPHVKWAKPYAAGTTSAAFFLEGRDTAREVVEIVQRFDLKTASSLGSFHSPMYDSGTFYGRLNTALVTKHYNALLAPGKKYDVLVFSGRGWDHLTDHSKSRVKEMIKAGTGLVWIHPLPGDPGAWKMLPVDDPSGQVRGRWEPTGDDHFITSGIPWNGLPEGAALLFGELKEEDDEEDDPLLKLESNEVVATEVIVLATCRDEPLIMENLFGKGKVITLAFNARHREASGLIPHESRYPKIQYPYWEHHYALVGRAILYAAGKSTDAAFVEGALPATSSSEAGPMKSILLKVKSRSAIAAKLEANFIDKFGRDLGRETQDISLKPGINKMVLKRPALPAGLNFAHLILKCEMGVLDFRAIALKTEAGARIAGIKGVKETYNRSENLEAIIRVNAQDAAGLRLRLAVSDNYGRELFVQQNHLTETQTASLTVPLKDFIALSGKVEASLSKNGVEFDYLRQQFVVIPLRTWDRFEFVPWGGGTYGGCHEHLFDRRMKEMRRMGMTGILMNPYDYTPAYIAAVTNNNLKMVTKGGSEAEGRKSAKYGGLLNIWADEQVVHEDRTEKGITAFMNWLNDRYEDIEALNKVWETAFKDWKSVKPLLDLDDAIQRNSERGKMNFSPWSDYRDYLDWKFAHKFELSRKEFEKGDPNCRFGVSGTQIGSTKRGNDWWLLTRVLTALMNYGGGDQFRQHRSFSDMPLTPWAGYGKMGPRIRHQHWSHAFNGMNGVGYFAERTLLEPDFTWFEGAEDTHKVIEELRVGPAKLLMNSELVFDPIAFHYSQSSFHGSFALKQEKSLFASRAGMVALIQELGFQHFYLSYEQLEKGELTLDKARIFFMPHSMSISQEESDTIQKFVSSGGILVADLLPAIMDEKCRAASPGLLDNVFGVVRSDITLNESDHKLAAAGKSTLLSIPKTPLEATIHETQLTAASATALAQHSGSQAPAMLVNRFGKGTAILLNGNLFSKYNSLRGNRTVGDFGERIQAMEDLMSAILKSAGLKRHSHINTISGDPLHFFNTWIHRTGRNEYVCLARWRGGKKSQMGQVKFSGAAHTYDVASRRNYGNTETVKLLIEDPAIHLFARLSYAVNGIVCEANDEYRRGEIMQASIRIQTGGDPEMHIVRMEVTDPEGRRVPHYDRNLLLENGKGEANIPFALNDPVGAWRIRFRDVATGVELQKQIELK